jgi:hypothetical protein
VNYIDNVPYTPIEIRNLSAYDVQVVNTDFINGGTAFAQIFSNAKTNSAAKLTVTGGSYYGFTKPATAGDNVTVVRGMVDVGKNATVHRSLVSGTVYVGNESAAPSTGTWTTGSVIYNTGTDNVLGWKCTSAGTPGTWKAMSVTLAP